MPAGHLKSVSSEEEEVTIAEVSSGKNALAKIGVCRRCLSLLLCPDFPQRRHIEGEPCRKKVCPLPSWEGKKRRRTFKSVWLAGGGGRFAGGWVLLSFGLCLSDTPGPFVRR